MDAADLTTGDQALLRAVERANQSGTPFGAYDAAEVLTGVKPRGGRWAEWSDEEKAASKLAHETFSRLYALGMLHASHVTWKLGPWRGR